MIVCNATAKHGSKVHRQSVTIALESALRGLMGLYDQAGGADSSISGALGQEIEHCLGEREAPRDSAHSALQHWLRARELHQYILAEPELTDLKLRVCEYLLYHRSAAERWAAIRELLLEHLDRICATPLPGLTANVEPYKRALSDREGPLGRLLLTVALFNLELEGERPPANLVLRFRRGDFPLHWWELCNPDGRATHLGTMAHWSPANPLCRWEYLATDLAHALFRRLQAARPLGQPAPVGAYERATPARSTAAGTETLYCRLFAPDDETAPAQLELFPLELGTLVAGLLRATHRRHGPGGVKLLAVLCAAWGEATPGAPLELSLGRLAAEAGLGDVTSRGLRTRTQRLERIVADLARVELTRVSDPIGNGAQARARTSRLVTLLGRSGGWSHAAGSGMDPAAGDLRLLLDPCAHDEPEGGLAGVFRDLPPLLLECAGPRHPSLLPLYVWLRRLWSATGATPAVERTARALLDECGVWVSDSNRYRAVEALKRDLEFLREQGWLGAWRLQRSSSRDALEDRYQLIAPGAQPIAVPHREATMGATEGPTALTGT